MIKQLVVHSTLFSMTVMANTDVGIDYLNTLRAKTGLPVFIEQVNLTASAQNHSDYLQTNNISGHYEDISNTGYTGDYAADRAIYTGYFSRTVSENVSYGSTTVQGSIDNLFSAIYHRFGFLTLSFDEVGIGISSNNLFYTYNMGNSTLNDLCENGTYSGGSYYQDVCADTAKKIDSSDYVSASDNIKAASPDFILWPPVNSDDIPPVFYEESPDPLSSHSVTGYPISVEFNNGSFSTAPTLSDFTLEDTSGTVLSTLTLMNETNDPNSKFSVYQYALFPEKRLEWGSQYMAEIIYVANSVQYAENWCFTTRSLQSIADRFYRIENIGDIELNVISGKSYAIYVVPNDSNDALGGVSYSASTEVNFDYIDGNTFYTQITATSGNSVSYTFSNGQKIKLTIASSDTAEIPSNASCSPQSDFDNDGILDITDTDDDNDGTVDTSDAFPLDPSETTDTDNDGIGNNADKDDDNDGISDTDELANGLNPLNASDAQADFDADGFSNSLEISLGTDIRVASSTPKWVLIPTSDGLMIPVPYVP